MRAKITKRVVDGAEPGDATYLVRDTEVKGFVLVVTPAGAKSYAVDYRAGSGRGSPKRRLTIGKHGSPWTPETARTEAKRLLAEVAAGRDPATARQEDRKALTFAELIDSLLGRRRRPQEALDPQGRSRTHRAPSAARCSANCEPIALFAPMLSGCATLLRPARRPRRSRSGEKRRSGSIATGGKGVAAQCVTLVSAIFAFAIERGLCADNPARGVKKAPVRKVERFLSEAEIARLAAALDAEAQRTGNPYPVGSDQAVASDRLPARRDRQSALGARRFRASMPAAARQQDRRQGRLSERAGARLASGTPPHGGQPAGHPRHAG